MNKIKKLTYEEIIKEIKCGNLLVNSEQWRLSDQNGWSIAHEAAYRNYLPDDFDQWDIRDNDGWTVAHEASKHGHLPIDFNQWELCNNHK